MYPDVQYQSLFQVYDLFKILYIYTKKHYELNLLFKISTDQSCIEIENGCFPAEPSCKR